MVFRKKHAEGWFRRLAGVMGKEIVEGDNYLKVGAWRFDYSTGYGGAVIEEIDNEGGGVTRPLGDSRLKPWEFGVMCEAVISAVRICRWTTFQTRRLYHT